MVVTRLRDLFGARLQCPETLSKFVWVSAAGLGALEYQKFQKVIPDGALKSPQSQPPRCLPAISQMLPDASQMPLDASRCLPDAS
jgi:hypothetical protein